MLGVGGTRSNMSRKSMRGGGNGGRAGGGLSPQAQKKELLRKLQEGRAESSETSRTNPAS